MKNKVALTGTILVFLFFIIPFFANATSPDNAALYAKQAENSKKGFFSKRNNQETKQKSGFFSKKENSSKNTKTSFFRKKSK